MIKIRIIGCGCDLCKALEENMKSAVNQVGAEHEFLKVCDYATRLTPILFINDKMISSGKVFSVDELVSKLEALSYQKK